MLNDTIIPMGETLEQAKLRLILNTLLHYNGCKYTAADTLDISLKTLYNILNRHNIPLRSTCAAARAIAP